MRFLHGHDVNAIRPLHESAFGGYRLMAVEEELALAVAVIQEARRKPIYVGERLSKNHMLAATILIFALTRFWPPLRRYKWHDVDETPS